MLARPSRFRRGYSASQRIVVLPQNYFWVAKAAGTVVGFIAFSDELGEPSLHCPRNSEGRRVGSGLLAVAQQWLPFLRLAGVLRKTIRLLIVPAAEFAASLSETDGAENEAMAARTCGCDGRHRWMTRSVPRIHSATNISRNEYPKNYRAVTVSPMHLSSCAFLPARPASTSCRRILPAV